MFQGGEKNGVPKSPRIRGFNVLITLHSKWRWNLLFVSEKRELKSETNNAQISQEYKGSFVVLYNLEGSN